jgi:hypothetical protein
MDQTTVTQLMAFEDRATAGCRDEAAFGSQALSASSSASLLLDGAHCVFWRQTCLALVLPSLPSQRADLTMAALRRHSDLEKTVALKYMLLARGAFNLLFGLFILASMRADAVQLRGGLYAAIDGLLALAVAVALLRSRARWLFGLALVDALIRLGYGAMQLANPWIQKTVVLGALFDVGLIFLLIALGIVGIVYVLLGKTASIDPAQPRAMTGLALVISLFTLLLGVGFAFGILQEERRAMLACYAVAMGLALGYAGLRVGRFDRMAPPAPTGGLRH